MVIPPNRTPCSSFFINPLLPNVIFDSPWKYSDEKNAMGRYELMTLTL